MNEMLKCQMHNSKKIITQQIPFVRLKGFLLQTTNLTLSDYSRSMIREMAVKTQLYL